MTNPNVQQAIVQNQTGWDLNIENQRYQNREVFALLQQAHIRAQLTEIRLMEQEKKIRELESLASTDPLTGLMNRRGFEEFFAQEHSRISRGRSTGSVLILFDLDSFKEINDTFGHQAGDACLKRAAEYLKSHIRDVDAAARLGGDEFAVLLSDTDVEKTQDCIRVIKKSMDALFANWQGQRIRFGASVGIEQVAEFSTFETAYYAADRSLYDNKRERKPKDCTFLPVAAGMLVNA